MSTSTATAPAGTASTGQGNASLGRGVRSEWRKIASLRSTWVILVLFIGSSLAFAAVASTVATDEAIGVDGQVASVLGGVVLLAPLVAIFGALVVSAEYTSGTITATLTAVPRRWPVLAAKAVLLVLVVAAASLLAGGLALLVFRSSVPAADAYTLTDGPAVAGLLAFAALMVTYALVGLGIATLLRSTAGAVTALVVLLYVLPVILQLTGVEGLASLTQYWPSSTEATLGVNRAAPTLSTTAAVAVLVGWALVPLTAGLVALQRRDA